MIQKGIFFICSAFLFMACGSSMIYSPSVNLSHESMQKYDIYLQGSLALFPEARPNEIGQFVTVGQHIHWMYAFSNRFSLSFKEWSDFATTENNLRFGGALTGQLCSPIDSRRKFVYLPRIGFTIAGIGVGFGAQFSAVYQDKITDIISIYYGLGGLWGMTPDEKGANGYVVIGHIGITTSFNQSLKGNFEYNPIYQINKIENVKHFISSFSVGLGYMFK